MAGGVGFVLGFIAAVFVHHATAQTVHVVGDTTGWTIPATTSFYSEWADKNTFAVGDSLSFKFMTGAHNVAKVSKESFEACNSDDAIGNVLTMGPATVKLDTAGVHYFICSVGRHCMGGQKLSVTVSGASATPGGAVAPSSNTTDKPTGGAVAPSSNTTDEPTATPTPANSPTSSLPNSGGSAAAPAPSSSTAVMASIYVTLSAIVMNTLF